MAVHGKNKYSWTRMCFIVLSRKTHTFVLHHYPKNLTKSLDTMPVISSIRRANKSIPSAKKLNVTTTPTTWLSLEPKYLLSVLFLTPRFCFL